MNETEKNVLENQEVPTDLQENIVINQADLTKIEQLLEKQVEYLEEEKQEKLELEKQQELQEKQQEELTAEESAKLEEQQQKSDEVTNTITENLQMTATGITESNEQLTLISSQLATIIENQENTKKVIVEGAWIITITLALAVGLKIFWDHVLKW